jgi:hypothetical protein
VAQFRWEIEREEPVREYDSGTLTGIISPNTSKRGCDQITELGDMVESEQPETLGPLEIKDILPKYILFTKFKHSAPIPQLSSMLYK